MAYFGKKERERYRNAKHLGGRTSKTRSGCVPSLAPENTVRFAKDLFHPLILLNKIPKKQNNFLCCRKSGGFLFFISMIKKMLLINYKKCGIIILRNKLNIFMRIKVFLFLGIIIPFLSYHFELEKNANFKNGMIVFLILF